MIKIVNFFFFVLELSSPNEALVELNNCREIVCIELLAETIFIYLSKMNKLDSSVIYYNHYFSVNKKVRGEGRGVSIFYPIKKSRPSPLVNEKRILMTRIIGILRITNIKVKKIIPSNSPQPIQPTTFRNRRDLNDENYTLQYITKFIPH